MVSTLTLAGLGLMLAGLVAVVVEAWSGAGSASRTFGTDEVEKEAEGDEPYGVDD